MGHDWEESPTEGAVDEAPKVRRARTAAAEHVAPSGQHSEVRSFAIVPDDTDLLHSVG